MFEAKVERLFKIYACNDQAAKKVLIKLNYVPKKKVTKNYPPSHTCATALTRETCKRSGFKYTVYTPSILDTSLIEDEFDELM